MGKVMAIANSKGGVGKSTISRNIALTCAANDLKTLAVDADPQGSLYKFFTARKERLEAVELDYVAQPEATALKNYIQSRSSDYDQIIIDVGGRDSVAMRYALLASDVVLVPVTSGQESIDALEQMIDAIVDAKAVNSSLRAFLLINMAPSDAFDDTARITAEGLANIYKDQLEVLDTRIKARKAWLQSGYNGSAIWEVSTKGENKASTEFFSMISELIEKEIF